MSKKSDAVLKELKEHFLKYPGAHMKSPWPGHGDLAVNDKTFAYLSTEGSPFSLSCKLPRSCGAALMLPQTSPTGYGLGKSGWVTGNFGDDHPPIDVLKEWIEESYRAQAPKKLIAQLDGGAKTTPAAEKPTKTKTKKAPAKAAAKPATAKAAKKTTKQPSATKKAPAKKQSPKRT